MPSCEQPLADTRRFRGVTPPPVAETTTLPGGRIVTIVIAGAGVFGGVGTRPVPVSVTKSGLLPALVITVTLADLAPAVTGENTTFQLQEVLGPNVVPQVFELIENSLALVPVKEILVMFNVPNPVLLIVTFVGELDVPSS